MWLIIAAWSLVLAQLFLVSTDPSWFVLANLAFTFAMAVSVTLMVDGK
jgi:hypothetical protein